MSYGRAPVAAISMPVIKGNLRLEIDELGLEARVSYAKGNPAVWQRLIEGWQSVGATHISLLTTDCGFTTPDEHIAALRKFAEAMGLEKL